MNLAPSPFSQICPVVSASAMRVADAIVGGKRVTLEMTKALPQDSLVFGVCQTRGFVSQKKARNFEVDIGVLTLKDKDWVSNFPIDAFTLLLPLDRPCFSLPTNWLVGSHINWQAGIMLGLQPPGGFPATADLVSNDESIKWKDLNPVPIEATAATLSEGLHGRLLDRYDRESMQLRVANKHRVVCICHNGKGHYRLFVISIREAHADFCIWDPLALDDFSLPQCEQAQRGLQVLQKVLPHHQVRLASIKALTKEFRVLTIPQRDGHECAVYAIKAMIGLVCGVRFSEQDGCLRSMRVVPIVQGIQFHENPHVYVLTIYFYGYHVVCTHFVRVGTK